MQKKEKEEDSTLRKPTCRGSAAEVQQIKREMEKFEDSTLRNDLRVLCQVLVSYAK